MPLVGLSLVMQLVLRNYPLFSQASAFIPLPLAAVAKHLSAGPASRKGCHTFRVWKPCVVSSTTSTHLQQ
jgi:hypothetical protein